MVLVALCFKAIFTPFQLRMSLKSLVTKLLCSAFSIANSGSVVSECLNGAKDPLTDGRLSTSALPIDRKRSRPTTAVATQQTTF